MYKKIKLFLILSVLIGSSTSVFAQTSENGIETRKTKSIAQRIEHSQKRDSLSNISLTKAYADFKKHYAKHVG